MRLEITSVQAGLDHHLQLHYNNGETRRFDMRPLLTMKPWNRLLAGELFLRATVGYGTVVWPGGLDVAPETLYDDSVAC